MQKTMTHKISSCHCMSRSVANLVRMYGVLLHAISLDVWLWKIKSDHLVRVARLLLLIAKGANQKYTCFLNLYRLALIRRSMH